MNKFFKLNYTYNNYHQNHIFNLSWIANQGLEYKEIDILEQRIQDVKELLRLPGVDVNGEIIYAGKGSNIPRHKLKSYIEENSLKKTSRVQIANTIIFDKNEIEDVLAYYNRANKDEFAFIEFTKEIYDIVISYSNSNRDRYSHFDKEIKSKIGKTWVIEKDRYYALPSDLKKIINCTEFKECYEMANYRTQKILDICSVIDVYLKDKDTKSIVWDDYMLEILNSDGIELDAEYLETFHSMLKSNEPSDIQLALEMLTNINLEKDGLTVALLLNEYKDKFSWGTGNQSQAYKTLNKYFESKEIYWKHDFRGFSAGLWNYYSNDNKAKEIISGFIQNNINKYLSHTVDGFVLQIDSFNLSLYKRKK